MERGVGRRKLVISKLKDSNPTGQSFSSPEVRHIRNPKNDPGNAAWSRPGPFSGTCLSTEEVER